MKLKKMDVLVNMANDESIGDDIIKLLYDHFNYSINDIKSYNELTAEEKKIIPEQLYNHITEQ